MPADDDDVQRGRATPRSRRSERTLNASVIDSPDEPARRGLLRVLGGIASEDPLVVRWETP